MCGCTGVILDVGAANLPVIAVPTMRTAATTGVLAASTSEVLTASQPMRASVAFGLVLLFGGVLHRRYDAFVDRSIDATVARPLTSLGYGVAAHAVIGFATLYLNARFAAVDVSGWDASGLGVLIGLGLGFLAAGLGFVVVGTILVDLLEGGHGRSGPFVGALVAGGVAATDPRFGGVVWLVLVSVGIGGAVRRWVHATAGPDV